MGTLRDIDLSKGPTVSNDVKIHYRNIVPGILATVSEATIVVLDLPEFITALTIVAVILGVLFASEILFKKSREVLSGIWIVGSTLVKGLDAIYHWVYSLFDFVDGLVMDGVHDIAQHIVATGQAIYNLYSRPFEHRISALESQVNSLQKQITSEASYSHSMFPAVVSQEASDIHDINSRVTTVINDLNASITHVGNALNNEITNRVTAINDLKAALISEINARTNDESILTSNIEVLAQQLGQQVAALSQTISTVQTTLQGSIQATESQLQGALVTIGAQGAEIQTQQGEIATEAGTISELQTTTASKTGTIAELLALSGTAIATLIELADNPCMCLDPIGGMDSLLALIAGLEVGVL